MLLLGNLQETSSAFLLLLFYFILFVSECLHSKLPSKGAEVAFFFLAVFSKVALKIVRGQ